VVSRNLNKNEAKVLWAGVVLERLISSKDPLSMKELFSPRGDGDLEVPQMRKMAMSKDWQRKLMSRLIEEELAIRSGSLRNTTYEIGNKDKAIGLLTKAANDTVYIKHIIWPNEYPLKEKPEEEPVIAHNVGSDVTQEQEENTADQLIRGVAALIQISTNLYKKVEELEEKVESFQNGTTSQLKEIAGTATKINQGIETELEFLGEYDTKLIAIQELSSASADRTAGLMRLCTGINKKVDNKTQLQVIELLAKVMEFNSRGKNLINQMSSQMKKEDSLFKEIETVVKHLKQHESAEP